MVVAIDDSKEGMDDRVVRHWASAREVSNSLPRPASKRVCVSLRVRSWLSAFFRVRAN
jgi:hypothetical protein